MYAYGGNAQQHLAAVKKQLEPFDFMIVNLTPGTDTFFVAALERPRLSELKKCAKKAGADISLSFRWPT